MKTTLDIRIIELLNQNTDKLMSIADIAKQLKVAYSHAHLFINKLIQLDMITPQKVGKTIVCKLNYEQPLTITKLSEISYKKTLEWSKKDPRAKKLFEKVQKVKQNVNAILLHNKKVIIIANEKSDFSIFKNRKVINSTEAKKEFYKTAIILHGAEYYWNIQNA